MRPPVAAPWSEQELPLIDEHTAAVDVDPDTVWRALGGMLARPRGPITTLGVRVLGAQPARSTGNPLLIGSTLPGFAVTRAEPATELALRGSHHFARYALTFRLETNGQGTTVRAETRATFPGSAGRMYRMLVLDTGGHAIAVRRLLAAITRRAERKPANPADTGRKPDPSPGAHKLATLTAAARGAIGAGAKPHPIRMRAAWNDAVLAESDRTIVIEHNHYFPPEDVNHEYLHRANKSTVCWWKGRASYYDIVVNGARAAAAAWTYPTPSFAASKIANHVAFHDEVTVEPSFARPHKLAAPLES